MGKREGGAIKIIIWKIGEGKIIEGNWREGGIEKIIGRINFAIRIM